MGAVRRSALVRGCSAGRGVPVMAIPSPPRALASALVASFLALAPLVAPPSAAHALTGPAVKSSDSGVGLYVNKDGNSILRLTLPRLNELPDLYTAQELAELVKLRFDQVGFKRDPVWAAAANDAGLLERKLEALRPEVLAKAPEGLRAEASALLDSIGANLKPLLIALREKDVPGTLQRQAQVASGIAELQGLLFPARTLPYAIPAEFDKLPRLLGRAEIEMKLVKGAKNKNRFCKDVGNVYTGRFGLSYSEMKEDDADVKDGACSPENTASEATIRLTLDGYHAPLTAGNFATLVQSGFYDEFPIQQITDLSIQTGDGKKVGRAMPKPIPLELFYKRDSAPSYSFTSDEDKRGSETLALPFQSYGALGMARDSADYGGEVDNDSATSQFFFVKYDQALIPPGRNTLDGAYSCFGYTSQNAVFLKNIEKGDVIVSAKIIKGAENLVPGK